jgi:hypothetical protein
MSQNYVLIYIQNDKVISPCAMKWKKWLFVWQNGEKWVGMSQNYVLIYIQNDKVISPCAMKWHDNDFVCDKMIKTCLGMSQNYEFACHKLTIWQRYLCHEMTQNDLLYGKMTKSEFECHKMTTWFDVW